MKSGILVLLAFFAMVLAGRADEKLAIFNMGSQVYTNVTVTMVSSTDVFFTYPGGMGNVKIKNLSPEWQKHFKFDPDKARSVEAQQAQNQAQYHDEIIHQPVAHAPSEAITGTPASPGHVTDSMWRNDLPGALSQAQSEGKLVLLDFTGSDWCPWCIKFDHEVLSTDQFAAYAQSKLVLVRLDFPHNTPQPDDLKQANEALSQKFQVDSFPTYILLNADGRELGRQSGYQPGGPNAFMNELDGFAAR